MREVSGAYAVRRGFLSWGGIVYYEVAPLESASPKGHNGRMFERIGCPVLPRGLGVGSWVFAGEYWGEPSHGESLKTLHAALGGGVRHFDTAPAYGNGRAEQLLGQQLRKQRDNLFLSSKFYPTLPENVEKGLKRTLKRLMTDRLDAYYLHWPNEKCDLPAILEELIRLKEAGLIRNIGVSNFGPTQLTEALRWAPLDLCQGAYNLAWSLAAEELLPLCRRRGVTFVAYSPLAQGLLAASPCAPPPEDGRRALLLLRKDILPSFRLLQRRIGEVSREAGRTPADLALGWVLGAPGVEAALAGARTPRQMEANLAAAAVPLSASHRGELDRAAAKFRRFLRGKVSVEENPWGHRRS